MTTHSSSLVHYCTALAASPFLTIVVVFATEIAFFHDSLIDVDKPRRHVELWLTVALDEARHQCPPPSLTINFRKIRMPTEDTIRLAQLEFKEVGRLNSSAFNGLVIASHCQATDLMIRELRQQQTLSMMPILRIDFFRCHQQQNSAITENELLFVQRLELYLLNETNRDHCSTIGLNHWVRNVICSGSDKTQTVREQVQDCSGDELVGELVHPVRLPLSQHVYKHYINGLKLRLASLERPPFVIFEKLTAPVGNGTVMSSTKYKGFCYEIVHALQNIYNFTYEVDWPRDGSGTYGILTASGKWNGMMGMIVNGMIDVGVGPFSVTLDRVRAVHFSVPFFEEPTAILIPPPVEDTRLFVCVKPFQWKVWLCLLIIAAILPLILWGQLKLRRQWEITKEEADSIRPAAVTLKGQYLFVLCVLIAQSGKKVNSYGFGPRFLAAIWCLCAVVFTSAYIGLLYFQLSFPKVKPIINSLEEMSNSNLNWIVRRGTATESLFKEAKSGVYKIIGDSLVKQPGISLVDVDMDGIERTANGNYAFIKEKSYLEFAANADRRKSGHCRVNLAKEEFFKVNFAFALPKASPLQDLMDTKILQMLQAGLTEYWKRMYWPNEAAKKKCGAHQPNSSQHEAKRRLRLIDLQSAFLVLAVGFVIAFSAFVSEICFHLIRQCL